MRGLSGFWPLALLLILVGFSETCAKGQDCLPGYKFETSNVTILKGYSISSDELDLGDRSSFGVVRKLTLKSAKSVVYLEIYFSQSDKLKTSDIVKNIVTDKSIATAYAYNKQNPSTICVGDAIYTGIQKVTNSFGGLVLFSRHNVVIKIIDRSDGMKTDLRPIAEEIDKDIDSKVRVTAKEVDSYSPNIEEFSMKSMTVKEFSRNKVTVKIKDPHDFKTKRFYIGNFLIKQSEQGDRINAPVGPGVETLVLVVVNDYLLYSEKTMKITVTK